ncbi:RNA-binding S4 domain-containing protein [Clostridiisalibacter paucivorans]|uniref:RNA-binding S4 domain-containing protein n=1 Tax=Clostridiisalibacter paucivorans TaxID=408753 RepID=UPI00047B378E|nr:RNA-binding S4 domain-containing protein [Clostridiisalibacter paucivorans]
MYKEIVIDGEYIKLDQLLKYIGIAQTGGHAKNIITNGYVNINGEVVYQRGKKVKRGDKIEILNEKNYIIK